MNKPKKIIIDTDPGHDDALAIMLACLSSELDVLALTTVCGNSTIKNTTRNAHFILNFLNITNIPVYSGADRPLKRKLVTAFVHGASGLQGIDPTNKSILTNNASEKIIDIVKNTNDKITLVTLGPLTNIAQAIVKDPITMGKLDAVIIMGGAIHVPGNQSRVAEFNMFVDPDAAKIVLNFVVPKIIVPLDACNDVRMTLEDMSLVKGDRMRGLILKMMRPYIANLTVDAGIAEAVMYDPSALFYILEPDACTVEAMNLVVETKGTETRGMLVADKRVVTDNKGAQIDVVTYINQSKFKKRFITTLSKAD